MNCTEKEQETCQVEKRGCEGCYYNKDEIEEISKRFSNGTETIEDILDYCRNYEIILENGIKMRLVDKKYLDKLAKEYKKLQAERKEDKNKIKELESKLEEANKQLDLDYVDKNYIPVKKVIDKIEELDNLQKEMTTKNHNADNINDCYRYGDEAQKAMYEKEALEELLEDK